MTLEWKHIDWEAKVIKKVQFKTKRLPDVLPPLGNSAIEILECWKEMNRNSRFVFDLLAEDYDLNSNTPVSRTLSYISRKNRRF